MRVGPAWPSANSSFERKACDNGREGFEGIDRRVARILDMMRSRLPSRVSPAVESGPKTMRLVTWNCAMYEGVMPSRQRPQPQRCVRGGLALDDDMATSTTAGVLVHRGCGLGSCSRGGGAQRAGGCEGIEKFLGPRQKCQISEKRPSCLPVTASGHLGQSKPRNCLD